MSMHPHERYPEVTGAPHWDMARQIADDLRQMPASSKERELDTRLHAILGHLFPNVGYPDLAVDHESGNGPIDVYCRNVVFENKRQGKLDAKRKSDATIETPEDQATRYLDALASKPNMFDDATIGWRACTTDGKEWHFYDYNPRPSDGPKLSKVNELYLNTVADIDPLLTHLHEFINRSVKMTPPTDNSEWANQRVLPFLRLAETYEQSPEYDIKRSLWRGLLRGAFLNPLENAADERNLFARHTMLVVMARSVAESLRPADSRTHDQERLQRKVTEGFPSWLLDAAGHDGKAAINDLIANVNNYEWQAPNRDVLKNLYHTVIPPNIRHDFGEYYTPDWLARAVCEEVLDPKWRKETISKAVDQPVAGPAVLDPSCGSGTFIYHATQLLLDEARLHPELSQSPEATVRIVDHLVAGMDLHPIAVELSKTTKMLAFGDLATHYAAINSSGNIHLCDSLQWDIQATGRTMGFGELVDIPTDDPAYPIRLPNTLVLHNNFEHLLNRIFSYAKDPINDESEKALSNLLSLPVQDQNATIVATKRFREYILEGRNNVWEWYITNLVHPLRLTALPASRMVGNPPWVVFNAMDDRCPVCKNLDDSCEHRPGRQEVFKQHALDRDLWAGAHLSTQNDLAATFVATCVDYYLQTGGRFGFVLPYAALEARHWAKFRSGNWDVRARNARTLRESMRNNQVDLSKDAWDLSAVNAPPFPQASASVVFGTKVVPHRTQPRYKAISGIQRPNANGVNIDMPWPEVKCKLNWTKRLELLTKPSDAYASTFRNGATLFPQSLVVVQAPSSQAQGVVYFQTKQGTQHWVIQDDERQGQIEAQFIKPAIFSRLLLPFGTKAHEYVIAPFAEDAKSLLTDVPQGQQAEQFRLFWDSAERTWRHRRSQRSPATLLGRIDYQKALSSQLASKNDFKVIYNSSGSNLHAAVIPTNIVASHTFYWYADPDVNANHYLAAIFNAKSLNTFFKKAQKTDRHFMLLPVQSLPIPAYDAKNAHHKTLAQQSKAAHRRVKSLLETSNTIRGQTSDADVLNDPEIENILSKIDDSVRAIFPQYCG